MRFSTFAIPTVLMVVSVLTAAAYTPASAQDATPVLEKSSGQLSTTDVYWFPAQAWEGIAVPGAASSLVTTDEGASVVLHTVGLEPGSTVTLWVVIFNNPEECSHGEGPYSCGEGDLLLFGGDPAVDGTVTYGSGQVIGPDGAGHFDAYVITGDTSRVLGEGSGLINPLGAEFHLVVRSHGPVQPGLLGEQLSTFGGGCNNAPEGTGAPGDYECEDLQFAVHQQQTS